MTEEAGNRNLQSHRTGADAAFRSPAEGDRGGQPPRHCIAVKTKLPARAVAASQPNARSDGDHAVKWCLRVAGGRKCRDKRQRRQRAAAMPPRLWHRRSPPVRESHPTVPSTVIDDAEFSPKVSATPCVTVVVGMGPAPGQLEGGEPPTTLTSCLDKLAHPHREGRGLGVDAAERYTRLPSRKEVGAWRCPRPICMLARSSAAWRRMSRIRCAMAFDRLDYF